MDKNRDITKQSFVCNRCGDDTANRDICDDCREKDEEDARKYKFSDLIREKMTKKQFWKWVSMWKDSGDICDDAEDWFGYLSKSEQEEELSIIKKLIKK